MSSNYSDHSPAAAIAAAEPLSPLSSWLSPAAAAAAAPPSDAAAAAAVPLASFSSWLLSSSQPSGRRIHRYHS